jgi:membrane-bound acyltransferase YfiQ involved in biofilm formation
MSFSFIVSAIVSVLILRNKNNKLLSTLSAFILNSVILVGAAWGLYITDEEARMFGFVHYDLVFSIPIITWVNWLLLAYYNRKGAS